MTDDTTLIDWLSIRLAPGMTRPRFYSLLERFMAPSDVFDASPREIAAARGFDQKLAAGILSNRGTAAVHAHIDQLEKSGIKVITRDDSDYPVNLTHSALAPPLLFIRGTLTPEDKYSIAMVGSRHATQYGRAVARELSNGLARSGLTIISGFARGVDGESHNAALKAGGRTIAVLGCGLDICYPSEHRSLVEKVAESGALISEYPLGTSPERFNFPERNHVIAALALGTIVVEAAEKSGSLITARLAVEENRFIFAVPGDITRNNSRGANALIQQGARLVQRPRDVLSEMKEQLRGYLSEDLLEEQEAPAPARHRTNSSMSEKQRESPALDDLLAMAAIEMDPLATFTTHTDDRTTEAMVTLSTTEPPATSAANAKSSKRAEAKPAEQPTRRPAAVSLSADEQFFVDLLRHEAMVFDELAEHAFGKGIDVARLSALLMKLELRQVIRQLPGRYYVLFV